MLPLCSQLLPFLPNCLTSQLPKKSKESRNSFAFEFLRKPGKPEQLRLEAVKSSLQHDGDEKKREQQHITQCAPQSGASVLQGNCPMTGHTGLKFAKACESYFSSIIVIERFLKDNSIIVERYLYKRQQKRENQITSNNGSEKKRTQNI